MAYSFLSPQPLKTLPPSASAEPSTELWPLSPIAIAFNKIFLAHLTLPSIICAVTKYSLGLHSYLPISAPFYSRILSRTFLDSLSLSPAPLWLLPPQHQQNCPVNPTKDLPLLNPRSLFNPHPTWGISSIGSSWSLRPPGNFFSFQHT